MLTDDILLSVSKPGRYVGNEWNSVRKAPERIRLRVVLVFPDVYEVGMSHQGLKILYSILNAQPEVVCERCFAPWVDMEKVMRSRGIPLTSLESQTPLSKFDIIGFSLNSEMNYTNVLNMLGLAKIEKLSKQRGVPPLVIAGGSCCFNPEPLSEFFDLFCLGEGEELILEITGTYRRLKERTGCSGGRGFKEEILFNLSRIEGVYVPSYYEIKYSGAGPVKEILPIRKGVPARIRKRVISDFSRAPVPTAPPVPFIEVVHDRMAIEIMRGCTNGCRFCQTGMIYRPRREREIADVLRAAAETYRRTGYEEISLLSLSCSDYSHLVQLIKELQNEFSDKGVNISLPSLRVREGLEFLPPLLRQIRKSGITLAPEAGSGRLRKVINKELDTKELLKAAACAWREGWRRLKLYFMIGLPTEKEVDLDGIVDLAYAVSDANRKAAGFPGRVTVSISSFVPKPHSAFQWEGMASRELLLDKQKYLKRRMRRREIDLKFTDIRAGFIEAALSRGDRRVGKVILRAWKKGARFDSWSDHFSFDCWQEAFETSGLDPEFYVTRTRDYGELFPWEHLDAGIDKRYLVAESERAKKEQTTPSCQYGGCQRCGACRPARG